MPARLANFFASCAALLQQPPDGAIPDQFHSHFHAEGQTCPSLNAVGSLGCNAERALPGNFFDGICGMLPVYSARPVKELTRVYMAGNIWKEVLCGGDEGDVISISIFFTSTTRKHDGATCDAYWHFEGITRLQAESFLRKWEELQRRRVASWPSKPAVFRSSHIAPGAGVGEAVAKALWGSTFQKKSVKC